MPIHAVVKYQESDNDWDYKTKLKHWLSDDLEFSKIERAEFNDYMVLATVKFDDDNTIWVLVPEDIFQEKGE